MAWTRINHDLEYVRQGPDMCLYAGVEILLKYNKVKNFDQYDLYNLENSRVVSKIVQTLNTINDLKDFIIEYPDHNECTLDKIKSYIDHDCPVLVNLYDKHHSAQGKGHSYIIEAYDDETATIQLVDPNQDIDKKTCFFTYNEFQQKWINGPILELIAIRHK